MTEFWESSFTDNQLMWGFEPSEAAILTKNFFVEKNVVDVLIPGFGYGRNAKIFTDNGINVTGIEISKTAIKLARQNGITNRIFHGSVTEMPFDDKLYDGVFCYALIHLLNKQDREKLIQECYNSLKPNGYMVFTTISKEAPMYGKGKKLGEDYYELMEGLRMFFYDTDSITQEFKNYGLIEQTTLIEPNKNHTDKPPFTFTMIRCQKLK